MGPSRKEDQEREKLEGSLLNVCSDCKDMVVQVSTTYWKKIRTIYLEFGGKRNTVNVVPELISAGHSCVAD